MPPRARSLRTPSGGRERERDLEAGQLRGFNETWGAPAPAGPYGNPGPNGGGTATLGTTFNRANPSETWSLYLITTAAGDGTGQIAGGWCLNTTVQKAPLTIGTQVSSTPITVGSPFSDAATLTGVPSGAQAPSGTVTFNAYGPNDATCANAPAFTSTVALTGSGTTTPSGNFTPASTGTCRWTAAYSGDSNYTAPSTACGDAGETVVVNPAAPSIATTARDLRRGQLHAHGGRHLPVCRVLQWRHEQPGEGEPVWRRGRVGRCVEAVACDRHARVGVGGRVSRGSAS